MVVECIVWEKNLFLILKNKIYLIAYFLLIYYSVLDTNDLNWFKAYGRICTVICKSNIILCDLSISESCFPREIVETLSHKHQVKSRLLQTTMKYD